MTVFLWTQIFSECRFIKALWKELYGRRINYFAKILATGVFSVFILEFLVYSFTQRKLYTWCFLNTEARTTCLAPDYKLVHGWYGFELVPSRYEAVFYGALALALMAWILVENTLIYSSKVNRFSSSFNNMEDNVILDGRYLQLSDVRIPLIFMVLFNVAFFGTGNFASIASFEISSVYRFITVLSVSES
ncbi:hypothetical protein GBA52_025188 [Prunus armeniaca]|nr:hypothetical protein GBA52_025188 [Prunus armeniaca]